VTRVLYLACIALNHSPTTLETGVSAWLSPTGDAIVLMCDGQDACDRANAHYTYSRDFTCLMRRPHA
jgi:hypothetical protein